VIKVSAAPEISAGSPGMVIQDTYLAQQKRAEREHAIQWRQVEG
jgi:hypothetical protein